MCCLMGGGTLANFNQNHPKSENYNSKLVIVSFDSKQTHFSLKKFLEWFPRVLLKCKPYNSGINRTNLGPISLLGYFSISGQTLSLYKSNLLSNIL